MFNIEPKSDGTERPQMAWLRSHLSGTDMPKFHVTVKDGKGGGDFEVCTNHPIEADPLQQGYFVISRRVRH